MKISVRNPQLLPVMLLVLVITSCNPGNPEKDVIQLSWETNQTVTYQEAIHKYEKLDNTFETARLLEQGTTDAGKPFHLFVISRDKDFQPNSIHKKNKRVILVNNGVHPGEPCGIDASLQFANDILLNKDGMGRYLENTVICIVPVYSVGGALKRTPYIRSNQNSPEERGRRGNRRNLDLNRDYSKQDSQNAQSLASIFQIWQPDVFLDTHTTNGSDHQHTITLIPVQPSTLPTVLEGFLREKMLPALYQGMKETPYEMIPYVMFNNRNPENGIISYLQSPRVSTGYAQMFQVLGFMTENHVYKPYPDRVRSVYHFITKLSEFTSTHGEEISRLRHKAQQNIRRKQTYTLDYKLDTSRSRPLHFMGYRQGTITSKLTGLQYKGYDHSKPFEDTIPFYSHYNPVSQVKAPDYYIIPQAWRHVIHRMKINGALMHRLNKDTLLKVQSYYITNHDHLKSSYQGRYYHNKVEVSKQQEELSFYKGDYVVPVNQIRNEYIVQMLEPEGKDSFFRWAFFDPCLERRDWNHPGVTFETNAKRYLETHPELKEQYLQKKQQDPGFARDHMAQLEYIFNHSQWSKSIIGRYPVARLEQGDNLKHLW
ncbi:MAG: hypothetical protein KGY60_03845 [Bacteroidales bacterium]|nr:hypothetical protein [Bacteroidales bacterium]